MDTNTIEALLWMFAGTLGGGIFLGNKIRRLNTKVKEFKWDASDQTFSLIRALRGDIDYRINTEIAIDRANIDTNRSNIVKTQNLVVSLQREVNYRLYNVRFIYGMSPREKQEIAFVNITKNNPSARSEIEYAASWFTQKYAPSAVTVVEGFKTMDEAMSLYNTVRKGIIASEKELENSN